MRELLKINGRAFVLYEKSIKIEGLANFVFYGREVTSKDAHTLAAIIELGREEFRIELKLLFNL